MDESERHPDADTLRRHLCEQIQSDQSEAIESHLGGCPSCQQQLAQLAADPDWWDVLPDCLSVSQHDGETADQAPASPDDLWYVEHQQIQKLLSPTDDPQKIGRLGGYEVVGIVGAGATAVVLKAFEGPLNRFVAIKLLRPTLAASPIARQRFSREARSAASIVHENVIEIHGVSEVQGLPYLVMPYVRGESLAHRIENAWPIPTTAMLHIACQVADGLAAAHAKGLIHRDVKPSNILLGDGIERLKLTDFGLARAVDDVGLTRSGTLAGTPEYMSPEQAGGNRVDHQSDLFSLGSVLYAMCTGRPPFRSDSCYGVLRRIVEEQPRPIHDFNAEVPDWLCGLVSRLMEKDRQRRYRSAAAVATDLRQCLSHLSDPTHALPETLRPKRRTTLRNKLSILLAAIAVLTLVIAIIFLATRNPASTSHPTQTSTASPDAATNPSEPDDRWDDGVAETLLDVKTQLDRLDESLNDLNPSGDPR